MSLDRLSELTWGSLGIVHITSLAVGFLLAVGLYLILKRLPQKIQIIILGILSFAGIGAIIFNLKTWNSSLEYLPFHLCSWNALVLPIAVFSRSRTLNNLLFVWGLGAAAALIVNNAQADFEIFSPTFAFYYFPHLIECTIPILMVKLGLTEKKSKYIFSTVGITVGIYTVVHFINIFLNDYCIKNNVLDNSGNLVQVNYMYSLAPENPVFDLFWKIIPSEYWYMYCAIPLLLVYLAVIYHKELIEKLKAVMKIRKKA